MRQEGSGRKVAWDGRELPLKDWSRELGIPLSRLYERYNRGLSPAEILAPTNRRKGPPPGSGKGRRVSRKTLGQMRESLGACETPEERLCAGIVFQALVDYHEPKYQYEVERFFLSRWFAVMFNIDGEYMIDCAKRLRGES